MNFILKYFLRGLVILIPIVVTVYIFYQTFIALDRLIEAPFPGAGVLIAIALVILVGVLASNIVIRTGFELTERLFTRAPFVKIIYVSIKDLMEAFVGDRKKFNRPVAVTLSEMGGARALGFITRDDIEFLPVRGQVAVYFPQSYNFAGNLLLVDAKSVEPVAVDSTQMMAFIVSGGISGL
jgi:uncharacterized membrane protein